MEERRKSSDLRYALRCYAPVLYKGVTPCQPSMLKNMVLQSDQLHYVINQVLAGGTIYQFLNVLVNSQYTGLRGKAVLV